MSSDRLIVVASFESSVAAHAAVSYLEEQGIKAFMLDGALADTLWYLNTATGGAKVQVPEADTERAVELLRHRPPETDATSSEWTCGRCRETVDGGFDVCWSCGGDREQFEVKSSPPATPIAAPKDFREALPPLAPASNSTNEQNPYASPHTISRDGENEKVEERDVEPQVLTDVRRAFRAAIIGLVCPFAVSLYPKRVSIFAILFCPLLFHLYSLVLLVRIGFSSERLEKTASWQYYVALVIDLLVLGSVPMLLRTIFF